MQDYNLVQSFGDYQTYLHQDQSILVIKGRQAPTLETAQQAWNALLEVAQAHQVNYWIIDEKEVQVFNTEAVRWWMKEWFPQSQQLIRYPGQKCFANIHSERFYAEMSSKIAVQNTVQAAKSSNEKLKGYLIQQYFRDFAAAEKWLREMQQLAAAEKSASL